MVAQAIARVHMMLLPKPRPSLANVLLIDAVAVTGAVLYTVADRPQPPFITLFVIAAPIVAVGLWFQKFLRQMQVHLPFDFGYFFVIGWPVLIPVFAKQSHVAQPWRFSAALCALAIAPTLIAFLVGVAIWIF